MENMNAFLYKTVYEWHSLGIGLAYGPYVNIHNTPSKMEFSGRFILLMWKKKKNPTFFTSQRTFVFFLKHFSSRNFRGFQH